MADYKGTGVVFLRKLVKEHGEDAEKEFLAKLSDDEQRVYHTVLNVSRIPIEVAGRLFETACAVLMPDKPLKEALGYLGEGVAKDNLKGVYKVLVKVMTIPFLLSRAASLWKAYHSAGVASVEKLSENNINFIVEGYPDFPENMRDMITGYIKSSVEMCGGTGVYVERRDVAPKLIWTVLWE